MKAIRYHQYGGSDILQYEEAPIPEVRSDEVLIKVSATAFNPSDAMIRMGYLKEFLPLEFPFIPNVDVSGIIEKTGEDVEGIKTGDKVFAFLDMAKDGGAAEYVVTKAIYVATAPKNINLQDSAAIPSSSTTAWQGLFDHGKLQSGQRILIIAAAGGVGSFAVQLAKWKGAYVIGTASQTSFPDLKKMGIDEIIDYKNESIEDKIIEKVDVIFNLAPIASEDVTKLLHLLKKGGTLVSALNPADENLAEELEVNFVRMAVQQNAKQLSQIADLVDKGNVKPFITERVALNNLATVHKKVGQTRGKVLISVNDSL